MGGGKRAKRTRASDAASRHPTASFSRAAPLSAKTAIRGAMNALRSSTESLNGRTSNRIKMKSRVRGAATKIPTAGSSRANTTMSTNARSAGRGSSSKCIPRSHTRVSAESRTCQKDGAEMISDEERKIVAANLRQYLKKYETPDWRAFCNIILGSGRLDNLRKAQAFDRLADLIDRPTTTRHGKFRTKYGRETPCCEVCGYSIGDMRWGYCPKCGAVITDD